MRGTGQGRPQAPIRSSKRPIYAQACFASPLSHRALSPVDVSYAGSRTELGERAAQCGMAV